MTYNSIFWQWTLLLIVFILIGPPNVSGSTFFGVHMLLHYMRHQYIIVYIYTINCSCLSFKIFVKTGKLKYTDFQKINKHSLPVYIKLILNTHYIFEVFLFERYYIKTTPIKICKKNSLYFESNVGTKLYMSIPRIDLQKKKKNH